MQEEALYLEVEPFRNLMFSFETLIYLKDHAYENIHKRQQRNGKPPGTN